MNGRTATFRAFAGRFMIALVVGTLMMAGVVAGVNREVAKKLDRIPKIQLTTAPVPPGGANYLVVGSDTRSFVSDPLEEQAFGNSSTNEGQRSDTIMVVHVEPAAQRTLIVSFPRDLWVHIAGHGDAKINAAYNYGAQTLIDTINQNFDIPIQHYIELNFKSFVGLVDELGRVPTYIPYPARDAYTGLDQPNPGCVTLDGEQSLQWVRSRYLEYQNPQTKQWVYADILPDIGRIGRQQDFIRELAGMAVQKSLANPFTANVVADQVVKNLKVDDAFDKGAMFDLIDALRTVNTQDQSSLEFATMPYKGGPKQSGQDVLYVDTANEGQLLDRLRAFNDKPPPQPAPGTITVRVVNTSGRPGLATAISDRLRELGFVVAEPVEKALQQTPGVDVRMTSAQLAKGKLLLRYIEPDAQLTVVPQSDVDVQIYVGRSFSSIAVPADALQPTTTTSPTGAASDEAAPDVPLNLPPPPPTVQLPDPAPRGAC
jgi:LCP family protein required for cell wall assembly